MSESLLWHQRRDPRGRQLILFPYLGGFGASYNALIPRLSPGWDVWSVNPPGHGPSAGPPIARLAPLVDRYVAEIGPMLRPGAVFFGHSMGGIVAYCVLAALGRRRRRTLPGALVLSACRAPRDLPPGAWQQATDDQLLDHLIGLGAIPEQIATDRSLVEFFLPAFRADYGVLEDARGLRPAPLDVPSWLILGDRDPQTPAGTPRAWQDYLVPRLRLRVLAGEGHMYVHHAFQQIDRVLGEAGGDRVAAGLGVLS
ncbi:MAG: alpha/beta fold hydrolase [Micropruina sp.]|uniref:thioesterase II family protein n=1 Tax=Micropruina sp. TaxID=2737536 RepID=UPI0039E5FF8B